MKELKEVDANLDSAPDHDLDLAGGRLHSGRRRPRGLFLAQMWCGASTRPDVDASGSCVVATSDRRYAGHARVLSARHSAVSKGGCCGWMVCGLYSVGRRGS